jgi:predicted permease
MAGMTSDLPWTGYDENAGFTIEGKTFPPNEGPGGRYHFVSADYFRAVGVPLLAGRFFNSGDKLGGRRVVLINRSLARRYWPGENAVGRRFTFASEPKEQDWLTVVGVVGDVKDTPISAAAVPAFYWDLTQGPRSDVILALRASSSPSEMARAIREEVRKLDKGLALSEMVALETIAAKAAAGQRFTLCLFACFALTALALAAIGIYGVLSYLTAQRTREIGVRLALGALRRDVVWMTLRQGMQPSLVGVALGLAIAFVLTRSLSSLLYEVGPIDPVTFAVSALVLAAVALAACWFPARRAAKVDAMAALRSE